MQPEINAAKKPTINDKVGTSETIFSPFNAFSISRRASPKMGGMTIRKENFARFSFLLPNNNPVAMVLPDRESPGNTAQACAKPIMNASRVLMESLIRGLA